MIWKNYKLNEIIEIIGGGTPKTSVSENWNGNIPWLSVVDFCGDQKKVYKTEKTITQKGLEGSSTKMLRKGQLIISARGTVGELAMLGKGMAFNQSCYGLNGISNIVLNDFLYYLVKFNLNTIKRNTHGAVFDTITKQTFQQIDVSVPDLPTQTRIASTLSALDDKIELNRGMNQTLEQMAQALFNHYFVDNIDVDNLPEGWNYKKVSSIFDINIGRTPPRVQSEWFTKNSEDIKWISIKDMGNCGVYIFDTSEYLTKHAVKKFNVPQIPNNTVILSFKLTVGRVSITTEEMLSNEAIAHFNQKEFNHLTPNYTYLFLKEFDYNSLGNTSSIATAVNSQTIKNIDILVPSEKAVVEFSSNTDNIFLKIRENARETRTLINLRDTLLPKLMSGEIDVSDLTEEKLEENYATENILNA